MPDFVNHYEVLGVWPGSTDTEIRDVYLLLAQEHHPDKTSKLKKADVHAEKFKAITYSYSVLKNAKQRAKFDAELRLTMSLCPKCSGAGFVLAAKGFASAVKRSCTSCSGNGFTAKRGKK